MTDEAKALVANLRDEDSYYRIQEKHWCIDGEELERQRLAAADLIETQAREIERLRAALGWYEKQANDCRKITREGDDARYALDRDGGERARAALAGDSHDQ